MPETGDRPTLVPPYPAVEPTRVSTVVVFLLALLTVPAVVIIVMGIRAIAILLGA